MLGKLLKYEYKATARYFVPLFIALLVVAAVSRVCFTFDEALDALPSMISVLLYVAIIIAIAVLTLVITIKRFYSSLLTDEGYLMHTLPVTIDNHIVSKLVTSATWLVAGALVTIASLAVAFMTSDIWAEICGAIPEIMGQLQTDMGAHMMAWLVIGLIVLLLDIVQKLCTIYMCIAIGHQAPKHVVFASIGAYVAYLIIFEIIATAFFKIAEITHLVDWFLNLDVVATGYTFLAGFFVLEVVMVAVTYFVTRTLMKKRLNLE